MDEKKVFQLTATELASIVRAATKQGIAEYIKAVAGVKVDVPLLPSLGKKPWDFCDQQGCEMPTVVGENFCEIHKRVKKPKKQKVLQIADKNGMLTIAEAAEATGKTIATIYNWISQGKLTTNGKRPARVSTEELNKLK